MFTPSMTNEEIEAVAYKDFLETGEEWKSRRINSYKG